MRAKKTLTAVSILVMVNLISIPTTIAVDCIYCNCNKKLYGDIATCQSDCQANLGCFTGICTPVQLPGVEPTIVQWGWQKLVFPNMSCYSVTEQANDQYNCVASALGINDRFMSNEVDGYGNRDGRISVSDFDAFLGYAGYSTSANCEINQSGIEKIALFGEEGGNPPAFIRGRFHLARQASGVGQTSAPLFESKEGGNKRVIHNLQDFNGGLYGNLIKCYERQIP